MSYPYTPSKEEWGIIKDFGEKFGDKANMVSIPRLLTMPKEHREETVRWMCSCVELGFIPYYSSAKEIAEQIIKI